MSEKVLYKGEEILTRDNYGERVISGRLQDGDVFVWDSAFGWFNYGPYVEQDWEKTGEIKGDVEADY